MKAIALIVFSVVSFSCVSWKNPVIETQTSNHLGPYYIQFTFVPKNSHPIVMGGIGDAYNLQLLKCNTHEEFVERFFEQFTYTPLFFSTGYWSKLECLGLSENLKMDEWFSNFDSYYFTGDAIEELTITLKDGTKMTVVVYKLLNELKIEYIKDFQDCISASSVELTIENIRSITQVAILL